MTGKRSKNCSPTAGSPLSGNISDISSYYCKDQDRMLPIANVSRIMKKSLPTNAKISKEAKETVQECVSEFISFITGEASDKCQREKRKTVNGDDLLWAMTTLGFENYVNPLKVYLSKYRENEGEKNSMAREEEEDHHGEIISKVVSDSTSKKKVDFQTSSRNGLLPYYNHPLGEAKNIHITPKYYEEEDPAGSLHRVLGYGNNEVEGISTNMGVIATNNLQYGVEW